MAIKSALGRQLGTQFDSVFDVIKSNPIYDKSGGKIPTLDLNFAKSKSLFDGRSTENKITFSRASSGTYVGADGLIKTAATNEARFDHDPATGESLGLLIEEARTNSAKNSEDITSFRWSNTGDTLTRTANQISAPDGTTTADKIAIPSGSGEKGLQSSALTGTSIGTQITSSCFLKAAEHSYVRVEMQGGGNTVSVNVDLSDGSLISQVDSPDSYAIEAYKNDWYRISVTSTTTSTSASALRVYIVDSSGNKSFTGTVGDGFYVWGGQHEVGGFVSSYIPTAATAVTRAADVAKITGTNFSSWYNQSEGTVFTSITPFHVANNDFAYSINDGTSSNRIASLIGNSYSHYVVDGGSIQTQINYAGYTVNVETKAAAAYATNDVAYATDGTVRGTDTSATIPVVDNLAIMADRSTLNGVSGHIKRLSYFNTRLSDDKLKSITS